MIGGKKSATTMQAAGITWRKLGDFFKGSSRTRKFKIIIYNAIMRAKIMYATESMQLTNSMKKQTGCFPNEGTSPNP